MVGGTLCKRSCLTPTRGNPEDRLSTTLVPYPTQAQENARQKFIETKLSKLVVYEKTIDSIVGYVHQLDLFKNPQDLQSVLLPIPAVPESMMTISSSPSCQ